MIGTVSKYYNNGHWGTVLCQCIHTSAWEKLLLASRWYHQMHCETVSLIGWGLETGRCRFFNQECINALISVTAFQSRHLLHWPWCCFIGYLYVTILIIRAYSFITVNVVSSNARFKSNVRHQPPYLVLEPPYPHLSPEPLPPRDLWSYLFNDETWLEHKYLKKKSQSGQLIVSTNICIGPEHIVSSDIMTNIYIYIYVYLLQHRSIGSHLQTQW